MLEGGVLKQDDQYIVVGNQEKIDYIKQTFDLSKPTGIMSYYIKEKELLQEAFKDYPEVVIYSSISQVEGVDLSHLSNYIIYSFGFSGSKYLQMIDRITSLNGSNTDTVHLLLVKDAISDQCFEAVSKKKTFNDKLFSKKDL